MRWMKIGLEIGLFFEKMCIAQFVVSQSIVIKSFSRK